MASSDFGRMLSVGTICLEDRFCASKKGGIGGGGSVSPRGDVHMAAALAGCSVEKPWLALAGPFLTLFSTNSLRNHSPPLAEAPFLDVQGSIQSGRVVGEP